MHQAQVEKQGGGCSSGGSGYGVGHGRRLVVMPLEEGRLETRARRRSDQQTHSSG